VYGISITANMDSTLIVAFHMEQEELELFKIIKTFGFCLYAWKGSALHHLVD
jgi:hypothetical protein